MNLGFESETVEFKKTTGELREGIISLSSMLNKNGYGTLYFGVNNEGDVVGQQIGSRTLREISQAISNYIKPQIFPTITAKLIDEKNIIKVYVQATDSPYSAYGKYYIRVADEDKELTSRELKTLILKKSEIDIITKIEASRQDLTFNMLKAMFFSKGLTVNKNFEKNLDFVLDNGKYNLMAELLADSNDISIKVVKFQGKDKSQIVKRNEFGNKCLLIAMDQVINYVNSFNDTSVKITTSQREEENLFNSNCFREAWVNACLHTKWNLLNPPAVYLYDDRIEIISTGGLPNNLTKEEFFNGISRPSNIKLQKIFGQLGFVEQTGHGIPLIVKNYGKQAFNIMDNYLNVTLAFTNNVKESKEKSLLLTDTHIEILNLLKMGPSLTINQLTKKTKLSESYIKIILNDLKKYNMIKRKGAKKNGIWEVTDK